MSPGVHTFSPLQKTGEALRLERLCKKGAVTHAHAAHARAALVRFFLEPDHHTDKTY